MSETIEVESTRRLDVRPGETLVFQLPRFTSEQQLDWLRHIVEDRLPAGVKVLFAANRQPRGWYCAHMSITASCLAGKPVFSCGCKLLPLGP